VLADPDSAPISEALRATLHFLGKMTLQPDGLGPEDARAVLEAGVTRQALHEAIEVAFLFNVYDRLADSMGWHVPEKSSGYYESAAQRLLSRGYR
jgi:hypothetical protein